MSRTGLLGNILPTTFLGWVQVLSVVLVLLGLQHVVYNLFLHPLASFPGPKTAGVTRLYYIKQLLTGKLPFNDLELHQKYGPVVRIAPNELSFNTAEAWRDIYGTRAGKPEMAKNPLFYATTASGSVGLFGSTRDRHGPLRRLVSNGFSEKALREQEPLVQKYCDLFLRRIHQNCQAGSKAVDMVQWYNFFTFDVIGDLAFGESFGCLEEGVYHPWVGAIFKTVKAAVWLRSFGYYPPISNLVQLCIPRSLKEKRAKHRAWTEDKVRARKALKTDRADFLSGFLKEDSDASDAEMFATARTLIIAGSETTATLLSGVTYLLLKDRRVLKNLVDEVRSSFRAESEITFVGVNKLRYMLACLDEALRMYPPVPGSFPRDVPPGGDKIGDVFVPENTLVSVTQYATYHDEENFHLPDEFIPERWLGDERFANDNKAAFQPFSTGPRNCVGRNLAYVEMRVVLARLLWNFDLIEIDQKSNGWLDQNVYLLWEKHELLVNLKPVVENPSWGQGNEPASEH